MEQLKRKVFDKKIPPFERLIILMAVLRSPEGCSWDRKQTHESLLPYLIEETYEVVEAIENENYQNLKEELGDLLCQIIFHAQLAKEAKKFQIDDSINMLIDKLVLRHPHVFGDKKELSPQQVRDQWEKIKVESEEKKNVLSGLPNSMPALNMAYRIGEKAGGRGFDWEKADDVFEKIDEELLELKREIISHNQENIEEEIGDLLFAVASLARKLETNPEQALKKALHKFQERFYRLEQKVSNANKKFEDFSLHQLEKMWQQIK